MIALVWIKSFYNAVVFIISVFALLFALSFVDQVNSTTLPEAPKATQDLQKVFIPPIYRMQWFVFSFDALVLLYYIYQWPVWDCIKAKFPFFQYEAKTSEKADCTNLLLTVMFDLISKVSASSSSHATFRVSPLASFSRLASSQEATLIRSTRTTQRTRGT